jgi:hypothetical protein
LAKKKLTKSERLVDVQMLALLEWATDHPKNGTTSASSRRRKRRPNCWKRAASLKRASRTAKIDDSTARGVSIPFGN